LVYLGIFLLVAAGGIVGLWWSQRRQRMHLRSVHGFRSSLERISTRAVVIPGASREQKEPTSSDGSRRPEPLDPARREAAKRRLAHRRAARV
jgi:hypothetical protein